MSERIKSMFQKADERTGEVMQQIHESGELRHLYGKPLRLDDDPDWLVTRTLKSQGFSHPVLERAKELDTPRLAAEDVIERLARRRAWLTDPRSRSTVEDAWEFNALRQRRLDEYREKLRELNSVIRGFNLGVPMTLHHRPILVDEAVSRAEAAIPPLQQPTGSDPAPSSNRSRLFGFRRRD